MISFLNIPEKNRTNFSKQNRKKLQLLFQKSNNGCNLCAKCLDIDSRRMYHIDHIIPFAHSKNNESNNMQIICVECHDWKTHNNFDDIVIKYFEKLKDNNINEVNAEKLLAYQFYLYIKYLTDELYIKSKNIKMLKEGINLLKQRFIPHFDKKYYDYYLYFGELSNDENIDIKINFDYIHYFYHHMILIDIYIEDYLPIPCTKKSSREEETDLDELLENIDSKKRKF